MERIKKFKPKFNERLFLAIKLPLEIRREINSILSNFSKEARNFAFVDQEQLHLTLKFLGGNISPHSQKLIIEALKPIFSSSYKINISIDSLMFGFPKQAIPKVLYFNVNKNDELTKLASLINYRVKKLDLDDVSFFIEGKKLIFHLTVGRIKHSSNRHYKIKIVNLIKSIDFKPFEFEADKVFLIKSDKKGLHPVYTDIQSFDLKK
jgi:2'-5' RNA ligase